MDVPKTEKEDCHLFTSSTGLNCGGVGMQGWRPEMEDSHVITDLPSLPNHTFVAVFDGEFPTFIFCSDIFTWRPIICQVMVDLLRRGMQRNI